MLDDFSNAIILFKAKNLRYNKVDYNGWVNKRNYYQKKHKRRKNRKQYKKTKIKKKK